MARSAGIADAFPNGQVQPARGLSGMSDRFRPESPERQQALAAPLTVMVIGGPE